MTLFRILLVILVAFTILHRHANAAEKPNIIYILADDLGYGDLSCYGQKQFTTPHLDRMAQEGIRFTQHYAGSPICAPSRASLMTGLHLGHTEIRSNRNNGKQPPYRGNFPLSEDAITIPKVLKEQGYHTFAIGKWGLGGPESSGAAWKQGFDRFYGFLDQMDAHFYYPEFVWRGQEILEIPENKDGKRGLYSHTLFTDEALKFLKTEAKKEQPFFLYLAYTIPHAELLAPEEDMKRFRGKFDETPYQYQPKRSHYAGQEEPKAAYVAMISRMDRDVGRILDTLKKEGLAENTLVIFSSDNGPAKEGGADPAYFDSSGGLRGFKRSVAEGGIRVPMIAWWPGQIKPGQISDHVSAFWDVGPTLAELAGTNWPAKTDGISFAPTLLGEDEKQTQHAYLFWAYGSMRAIRMGDWKGLYLHRDGDVALYNLKEDPAETTDLAEKYPVIQEIIRQAILAAETPHPDWKVAAPKYASE